MAPFYLSWHSTVKSMTFTFGLLVPHPVILTHARQLNCRDVSREQQIIGFPRYGWGYWSTPRRTSPLEGATIQPHALPVGGDYRKVDSCVTQAQRTYKWNMAEENLLFVNLFTPSFQPLPRDHQTTANIFRVPPWRLSPQVYPKSKSSRSCLPLSGTGSSNKQRTTLMKFRRRIILSSHRVWKWTL